jgi:hypothetical protein
LSRRVRDLLDGDLGAYRDLPVDTDDGPESQSPPPVPKAVYSDQNWQTAWTKRHVDLQELAGVNDRLDEVDRRASELNRRAVALLEGASQTSERRGDIDA